MACASQGAGAALPRPATHPLSRRVRRARPPPRKLPPQSDPVDPKPRIEKECHKPCESQWREYGKCKDRIKAKGEGSCEPWAFDYWKCIDKCVSPID